MVQNLIRKKVKWLFFSEKKKVTKIAQRLVGASPTDLWFKHDTHQFVQHAAHMRQFSSKKSYRWVQLFSLSISGLLAWV